MTEPSVLERERSGSVQDLMDRAEWLRIRVIEMIDKAGLGHYSGTFSCAEILSVLYYHSMRLDPANPNWADRDRFLFGKGHAAVGLWPILADLGFVTTESLDTFGFIGSPYGDHPDMRKVPGCDFSSGSLGHNLSVGVGMGLAARRSGSDHRTFVLTGDGEIHEGQVWEAVMAASHYGLGNLIAIIDANGYNGSGETSDMMNIEPIGERFAAFGWHVGEVDGHDLAAVLAAFDGLPAPDSDRPTCIIARTVKGKGVTIMEENPRGWHIGHLTPDERDTAIAEITARIKEMPR